MNFRSHIIIVLLCSSFATQPAISNLGTINDTKQQPIYGHDERSITRISAQLTEIQKQLVKKSGYSFSRTLKIFCFGLIIGGTTIELYHNSSLVAKVKEQLKLANDHELVKCIKNLYHKKFINDRNVESNDSAIKNKLSKNSNEQQ